MTKLDELRAAYDAAYAAYDATYAAYDDACDAAACDGVWEDAVAYIAAYFAYQEELEKQRDKA